ncbi:hypothetical protein H6G06_26560 [Anabaena sphaerica FACHB-251]|uniref:Uncharacterized protein n=1 Tax=Anabaena sphaerica FACHB-251 TaxID=2692883 RepID=A0A926WLR5_9NOST|nr:hypothetical protein [Anabaena sphaerica]MBD2296940.1 hypothetical protein [Anabaena sphaerica FACHB-251]
MNLAKTFSKVLAATCLLLVSGIPFSVLAESIPTKPIEPIDQPLVVGDDTYQVLLSMPLQLYRNATNGPMKYNTTSSDGRFELISFLPALTQERKTEPAPAPYQLYRLALVRDNTNGKTIKAALPIQIINAAN